ncbi:MAG: DUF5916 domain-containing protein [Candidatus Eisenbacteria bacterium]
MSHDSMSAIARHAFSLRASLPLLLLLLAPAAAAWAAAPQLGPPMTIRRAAGPIVLDGNLDDAGWQGADDIATWYETNVGDNLPPQVGNRARVAYDDHYLYACFQFDDPHPELLRAPLGDHDAISSSTDYGGLIIDSRNDGKTAQMFLANASGLQYDAVSSDVSGEDNAPDFFWDCVGKVTATGWNLEIRIPFSTLRYARDEAPEWGLMLYRNYPRDRHYQFFSNRLPRDVNCFICNSSKLHGLAELPHGSHLVVAPFATAQRNDARSSGPGSPLSNGTIEPHGGLDLKWSPIADVTIDATYKPDFSQVESDAAQIGANERFALFYPEKRSFFLEGVDLFSTPFQAVYTRTVTSPSLGFRGTGRMGNTAFTALVTHDRGGGLVILPGPEDSGGAPQDFESDVGVLRVRHDLGQSFVSVLATGRAVDGGGHNAVVGPDFQWRPRPTDTVTGQALWSDTRTPNRDSLASEWDGRKLADRALVVNWSHNTRRYDLFLQGKDVGAGFRADDGFIPQVDYREVYFETGWTIRPKDAFLSRVRLLTADWYDADGAGRTLSRRLSAAAGMDGRWNSFMRVELNHDDIRVGGRLLSRFQPRVLLRAVPGRILNQVSIDTHVGQEIDFANAREGRGTTIVTSFTLRPNRHLALSNTASGRWLSVDAAGGNSGRLFSAGVERLRGTWCFNSRSFVRLIGQYVSTRRDTTLYTFSVPARSAAFSATGLFAYKLNFQTVLYLGYGDERTFDPMSDRLEHSARQVFAKISYAWQR